MNLERDIRRKALDLGFDSCRFTRADLSPPLGERLGEWLKSGAHGDMEWMETTAERRVAPKALWSEARSIVMLGANYGRSGDPLSILNEPGLGAVSLYARRRDYHDVLKGRLKLLAGFMLSKAGGGDAKVFVDTAPVMEKPLAQAAGLGWQGKHTNLVSREFGSWLLLGVIFTDLALEPDPPETDHCGACRKCLDVCPTKAFPAPYRLDARRCIAYLTIEHKGHIPREFRVAIGNRVFGCDDCLAVCPWNKFAQEAREAKLATRDELEHLPLSELAALDDAAFRSLFAGSPVKRSGHARFMRNVAVAMGNSGDARLAPAVERLLEHSSPLVRAAAVWAMARLLPGEDFAVLARRRAPEERDPEVLGEWAKESQCAKK